MVDRSGLEKKEKRKEKDQRYYHKHRDEILKKQSLYQKKKRKGIAKTEEQLANMNRDKFGRFLKTTGSTRYKKKQRDGKTKGEHVLIWEDYHQKKLLIGWCVHHKNENKKDNRIENLKAMTISKHTKYHFDKYYKKLQKIDFDIGVAPLIDNEFNRCKSNLRWLEWSALGVPTVASRVVPFQCIRPNIDGYLAKNEKEWYTNLRALIEIPKLRERI